MFWLKAMSYALVSFLWISPLPGGRPAKLRIVTNTTFSKSTVYRAFLNHLKRRDLLASSEDAAFLEVHLSWPSARSLVLSCEGVRRRFVVSPKPVSVRVRAKTLFILLELFLTQTREKRDELRVTEHRQHPAKRLTQRPGGPAIRSRPTRPVVTSGRGRVGTAVRVRPVSPRKSPETPKKTASPVLRRPVLRSIVGAKRVRSLDSSRERPSRSLARGGTLGRALPGPALAYPVWGKMLTLWKVGVSMHGQWGLGTGDPFLGGQLFGAREIGSSLSVQLAFSAAGHLKGDSGKDGAGRVQLILTLQWQLWSWRMLSFEIFLGGLFARYWPDTGENGFFAAGPRAGLKFSYYLHPNWAVFFSVPVTFYVWRYPVTPAHDIFGAWTLAGALGTQWIF